MRPFTIFVALLWTRANSLMSFLHRGTQNYTQYFRWDLTSVEKNGTITSLDWLVMLRQMHPGCGWSFLLSEHIVSSYSTAIKLKTQIFLWGYSPPFAPQFIHITRITSSQVENTALFKSHPPSVVQLSSLSRSPCKVFLPSRESTASPSFVSLPNLLNVHSTPVSISFGKTLKSTDPKIEP